MKFARYISISFLFLFFITGCSSKIEKPLELDLGAFRSEGGKYEYMDAPLESSFGEVSKKLDLSEEAHFEVGDMVTYNYSGLYQYDGIPLEVGMEFKQDKLQMIMFTFVTTDNVDVDALYEKVSTNFISYYGDDMKEESFSGENEIVGKIETVGMKWIAEHKEYRTMLQLTKSNGVISIAYGLLPKK